MPSGVSALPIGEYDASLNGVRAGSSDNRAAIIAALAAAATAKQACRLPPGVLLVTLSGTGTFIDLVSNITLRGHPNGTTIKVKDNNGNYEKVFGTVGGAVSNVIIEDLIVDQNYAGNASASISSAAGARQFVVALSAGSTDVTIRKCRFETCTGINTIVCSGPGSKRIRVLDSFFKFKKGATAVTPGYDNTAVYLEAQSCDVSRNYFLSDDYADCPGAAFEMHGALSKAHDNTVEGYTVGGWIVSSANSADQLTNSTISVKDNVITRGACGIGVLCQTGAGNVSPILRDLQISGNTISLLQAGTNHDAKESWGVDVRNVSGTVDVVRISDNLIEFEADTRTTSARWGSLANFVGAGVRLGTTHGCSNVVVSDNTIVRAPWAGFWLGQNTSTYVFNRVFVRENTLIDCGWNENGTFKSIAEVSGVWTDSQIEDNDAYDTATGATPNGTNGWRLYPNAAPVRTYWRRNTRTLAGSGTMNDLWSAVTGLLSAPYEGSEAITYAASVTPDPSRGRTKYITLTGNITLANPTVSLDGMEMTFILTQDGTGGRTTAFGALYKDNFAPDTTAGRVNSVTFRCDGTNWVQVGQATNLQ